MPASGSSAVPRSRHEHGFVHGRLGELSPIVAERLAAAASDISLVIDSDGIIRDLAVGNADLARDGAHEWLDRRWADTVALDSRHKIEVLLQEARRDGLSQWREVGQVTEADNSIMIRYSVMDAEHDGLVIAIGRDDRPTYRIQQRLMEAQQLIDRDYSRLRDAESLYLILFRTSTESIVIVDLATRKIVDVNPEGERLIGDSKPQLVGAVFSRIFDVDCQEEAASLLIIVQTAAGISHPGINLSSKGREVVASASLFRQGSGAQCLVRLTPVSKAEDRATDLERRIFAVMEHMPDACLVTDDTLNIYAVNVAFLDLARIATREQAVGQPLNRFLGRADLDRNLLVENLREHGSVRNFTTLFRNHFGEMEDVEVSAVSVPDRDDQYLGFVIRRLQRQHAERWPRSPERRRSVEQLTELVGRVKLKDLVRESTDLVEKLCIEAALELTKNNRASAADLLGLSRQSLYSKLHRFGLATMPDSDD